MTPRDNARISVLLALVCLTGCEPRSGVRVVRDQTGYLFTIEACSSRKDRAMGVRYIEVRRVPPGEGSGNTCALTSQGVDTALQRWHYGADVVGYQKVGCRLLEQGATYEVEVATRPIPVNGHFTIDRRGDVTMIDGECP
jgi:hypothetical protein